MDGTANISDIVLLTAFINGGGLAPCQFWARDVIGDGQINTLDIDLFNDHILKGDTLGGK